MADFTSTQAGNWEDGATWGNTSPGVAGTDFPGVNGDTATIGHVVDYDAGDSAVDFNDITINSGGSLIIPTDSDSTINIDATGVVTVNSSGTFQAGTSSTPIDSAYNFDLNFDQGSSARNVFVVNNGATIDLYGDSDYYGGDRYAYLDSDWTTGQSFYVTGDLTGWQSGQKFYIHENIDYDNYQDNGHIYTIDTVGSYDAGNDRTQITITETEPLLTFNAVHNTHQSKLIMISRNIFIGDPDAPLTVYGYGSYTERLRFDNNQGATNELINIDNVRLSGWDRGSDGGSNAQFNDCCFVSNNYGVYSGINHTITGDFVSNNYGVNSGTNHTINGNFVSNTYGVYRGINHTITGDVIGNNIGTPYGTNNSIKGDVVSCNKGILYGINNSITGNFIGNSIDVNLADQTTKYSALLNDCLIDSTDRFPQRVYLNSGTILPLVSGDTNWQTPPSGQDWIFEATPNSYCNESYAGQMEYSPKDPIGTFVSSGSQTVTFKIYPIGWTTTLDQDDIYIEAKYLDTVSGITRSTAVTGAGTFANSGWRDLEVDINPLQDGVLYFQIYIKRYESGAIILIDPEWSIA